MKKAIYTTPILLTTAVLVAQIAAAPTPACGQEAMPGHQGMHGQPGEMSDASEAYMEAMQAMMAKMDAMEMSGDPSVDFAQMMIPHHQSAIDMAEAYLQSSETDVELRTLAEEIIAAQEREIEFLEGWLARR